MNKLALLLVMVPTLAMASVSRAQPPAFSTSGLAGWEVETFESRPHTRYDLQQVGGDQVVHASCDDSASGLLWKGDVDLNRTPILHWRWKLAQLYPGIDERTRAGDDFPARVYVVTGSKWLPWTLKTLSYVWSNGSGPGDSGRRYWDSPYTSQARMVALHVGPADIGSWQSESRNVRADFQRVFDASIDTVGAVAIMSDCDDSHGKGQAWYGDLRFSAQ